MVPEKSTGRRVFIELGVRIECLSDRDLADWLVSLLPAIRADVLETLGADKFPEASAEVDVCALDHGVVTP